MRRLGRRSWFVVGLGALAVPLVATALAYGCTAVATLSSNPGAAPAGGTVTVTGRFFGTHDPSDASSNQPAEIRLGSVSGPVLATGSPSGSDRSFSVQLTVPAGTPAGDTFISATQKSASGTPVYGTPARQAFTVTAAAGAAPGGSAPSAPAVDQQVGSQVALGKALARCKAKYNSKKAKSSRGKRSMARKRAACVRRARQAHS